MEESILENGFMGVEHRDDPLIGHVPGPNARYGDLAQACTGHALSGMVTGWYEKVGLSQAVQREACRDAVTSHDQWEAERRRFRQAYQQALGPAQIPRVEVIKLGEVHKKDIVVEKLLFSSMEDHWVTANLYLPRDRRPGEKLPAVISACGHAELGKANFSQRGAMLALNGYVTLIIDPVGQGERRLLFPGAATVQHNCIGSRLVLGGYGLGWFLVQDNMAAVTMLQQHPAVDPQRIGMTGSSGGGWLTIHAPALDERIGVLAPAAAVRAFRHTLQTDDAEQAIFDMQRQGLDFPDLMGFLICPRPTFIMANQRDIWPIDQTRYAHSQALRFYQMQGKADRLRIREWDRGHVYEPDQLTQAIGWFHTWLCQEPDRPVVEHVEPENLLSAAESQVTTTGRLYTERGLPTPNRFFWKHLKPSLPARPNVAGLIDRWRQTIERGRPAHTGGSDDRTATWAEVSPFDLGIAQGRRIAYRPQPGLLLPMDMASGESPAHVLVVVDSRDRRDDLAGMVRWITQGAAVYKPDLRGWGETSPLDDWSDRESLASALYSGKQRDLHALAQIVGRDLVLDRTLDILAAIDIAAELSPGLEVRLHACRGGVMPALVAALVDDRVAELTLVEYLRSFREMMDCDTPLDDGSSFIRGLVASGVDMDDLLAAYPGRLTTRDAHDPMKIPAAIDRAAETMTTR